MSSSLDNNGYENDDDLIDAILCRDWDETIQILKNRKQLIFHKKST